MQSFNDKANAVFGALGATSQPAPTLNPNQHSQLQQRIELLRQNVMYDDQEEASYADWNARLQPHANETLPLASKPDFGADDRFEEQQVYQPKEVPNKVKFAPRLPKKSAQKKSAPTQQQAQEKFVVLDPREMLKPTLMPWQQPDSIQPAQQQQQPSQQPQRAQNKQMVLRVKRKRDEHPLDELLVDMPNRKRQTVKDLSEQLGAFQLSDAASAPLFVQPQVLQRFSLLDTLPASEAEQSSSSTDPRLLSKIQERRQLKSSATVDEKAEVEKNLEKSSSRTRAIRQERLRRNRGSTESPSELSFVDIDLSTMTGSKPSSAQTTVATSAAAASPQIAQSIVSMLKESMPQAAAEIPSATSAQPTESSGEFVYDLYYFDDQVVYDTKDASGKPVVRIEDFDEQLTHDDFNADEEYDSDDSNASNNPDNDYPEEPEETYGEDYDASFQHLRDTYESHLAANIERYMHEEGKQRKVEEDVADLLKRYQVSSGKLHMHDSDSEDDDYDEMYDEEDDELDEY